MATDYCDETLALLRANVAEHGLGDERLRVCKWDAAAGARALATLPVPLGELSHVIGADVVYHGGAVSTLAHVRVGDSTQHLAVDHLPHAAVAGTR